MADPNTPSARSRLADALLLTQAFGMCVLLLVAALAMWPWLPREDPPEERDWP